MTGRYFSYQIFWKEYRQMRGFWLGLFGITVLLQVILCFTAPGAAANSLYGLAICFTVLYALGCGATAFALEHENGTYDYLRSLPTKGIQTFISKIAFTVVSAPLLIIAVSASAAILGLRMVPLTYVPTAMVILQAVGTALLFWAAGSTLLFVWAAFFSLLTHHVVKAALLGGCTAVVSILFVLSLVEAFLGPQGDMGWLVCGVVVAVVAAVDVWLGARWFREASTWPSDRGMRERRGELTEENAFGLESIPSKSSVFGHLFWLQWRQSRGMLLILTAMLAPLAFSMLWSYSVFDSNHRLRELIAPVLGLSVIVAVAVVPLAGGSVFAGDQRQCQFRFLTDRGIAPKLVWWSRHPIWCVAAMVWIGVYLVLFLSLFSRWIFSGRMGSDSLFLAFPEATVLCIPLAYCFGQFCSMMFRSGILCGTFAIVGSILLVYWAFAMSLLAVPIYWSVLPIPVILLVATRVRTRGWMLESNSVRSWLPVTLVLVVPALSILSGVCLYRACQFPWVEPGFDVVAFTAPASAEAEETARMYRRAHDLISGEASEGKNDEAIALVLEASKRTECDRLSKYFTEQHFLEDVRELTALVRGKGERLQKGGDLDGAAEHYLAVLRMAQHLYLDPQNEWVAEEEREALEDLAAWCDHSGQKKERILEALREVEERTSRPAPLDNLIKGSYVTVDRVLEGDMDDMFGWMGRNLIQESAPVLTIYWMPWERERARRRLRMLTSTELQGYQQGRSSLTAGHQVSLPPWSAPSMEDQSQRWRQWWRRATPDAWTDFFPSGHTNVYLATTEWYRRTARIQMALVAWQLDHQLLPEKLDELKGEYLAEVPHDPYTGEPFVYFPKGVGTPITRYDSARGQTNVRIEADKPFFWSPGPLLRVDRSKQAPTQKYLLWDGTKTRQAMSPLEVWGAGFIFAIPQPR